MEFLSSVTSNIFFISTLFCASLLSIKTLRLILWINHMKKLPSCGNNSWLGDLPFIYKYRNDMPAFFTLLLEKFDKTGWCVIWISFYPYILLLSPEAVNAVLKDKKFGGRGWPAYFLFDGIRGLLTLSNEDWKLRRRLITLPFSIPVIKTFIPDIIDSSKRLLSELESKVCESVCLDSVVGNHVSRIFMQTSLGLRLESEEQKRWSDSIRNEVARNLQRPVTPFLQPLFTQPFHKILFRRDDGYKEIKNLCKRLVSARLEERSVNNTSTMDSRFMPFLDHMIDACLRNPEKIDSKNPVDAIIQELWIILTVAYETSTTTIQYALYDLARDQSIQDKLFKEVSSFDFENELITLDDLDKLSYLDCCIKETLRLRPPVSHTSRVSECETVLGGYSIPPQTLFIASIHSAHQHASLFPCPKVYDPERFDPERLPKLSPNDLLAFGSGPKRCIGEKLAMVQNKIVIAMIIKRFKVELLGDTQPRMIVDIASRFLEQPKLLFSLRESF